MEITDEKHAISQSDKRRRLFKILAEKQEIAANEVLRLFRNRILGSKFIKELLEKKLIEDNGKGMYVRLVDSERFYTECLHLCGDYYRPIYGKECAEIMQFMTLPIAKLLVDAFDGGMLSMPLSGLNEEEKEFLNLLVDKNLVVNDGGYYFSTINNLELTYILENIAPNGEEIDIKDRQPLDIARYDETYTKYVQERTEFYNTAKISEVNDFICFFEDEACLPLSDNNSESETIADAMQIIDYYCRRTYGGAEHDDEHKKSVDSDSISGMDYISAVNKSRNRRTYRADEHDDEHREDDNFDWLLSKDTVSNRIAAKRTISVRLHNKYGEIEISDIGDNNTPIAIILKAVKNNPRERVEFLCSPKISATFFKNPETFIEKHSESCEINFISTSLRNIPLVLKTPLTVQIDSELQFEYEICHKNRVNIYVRIK